jgi:hypothetical protein
MVHITELVSMDPKFSGYNSLEKDESPFLDISTSIAKIRFGLVVSSLVVSSSRR